MITRYFSLDVHKNYVVAAAVDREQQTLMQKESIPMDHFGEWVEQNLTHLDEVALEVTTNAWPVVDLVREQLPRAWPGWYGTPGAWLDWRTFINEDFAQFVAL